MGMGSSNNLIFRLIQICLIVVLPIKFTKCQITINNHVVNQWYYIDKPSSAQTIWNVCNEDIMSVGHIILPLIQDKFLKSVKKTFLSFLFFYYGMLIWCTYIIDICCSWCYIMMVTKLRLFEYIQWGYYACGATFYKLISVHCTISW